MSILRNGEYHYLSRLSLIFQASFITVLLIIVQNLFIISQPRIKPSYCLEICTFLSKGFLLVGQIRPHSKSMFSICVQCCLIGFVSFKEDLLDRGSVFWSIGSIEITKSNTDWSRNCFPFFSSNSRWMSSESCIKTTTFSQESCDVFSTKAITLKRSAGSWI